MCKYSARMFALRVQKLLVYLRAPPRRTQVIYDACQSTICFSHATIFVPKEPPENSTLHILYKVSLYKAICEDKLALRLQINSHAHQFTSNKTETEEHYTRRLLSFQIMYIYHACNDMTCKSICYPLGTAMRRNFIYLPIRF